MVISNPFKIYKPAILSLPKETPLSKQDLLVDDFLMARSGKLEMYYAPHNEYRNPSAKVVIVGLTPGWTQMRRAMEEARSALAEGLSDEEACRKAKEAASFAGAMRTHLIGMLNALELHRYLHISSCEQLFQEHRTLLHTTALLKYPVFVAKQNYNGTHPALLTNDFLRESALSSVREDLTAMNRQPLIIPLGKTVERVLQLLVREGSVDGGQCLWGFPHPSGANGHRLKQFAEHQERMKSFIHNRTTPQAPAT